MDLSQAVMTPPSRIRLIAALADRHPGTLRLFYGEDTLPTPDFIKEAAKRAIDANRTYYTPNSGEPALREAIARQAGRLHGVDVAPDEVVVTTSGMVAIALACQATLGPSTSALVVTPLWPNFASAIRVVGAEAIEVPLRETPERYELDLDALRRAARPDTRALALAGPGNPTGWTPTAADWRNLADFCIERNLWLIADGVYERLVYDGDVAPSPLAIPEIRPRLVVTQSFSKTYRMTGWRIGYALAPVELARELAKLQEFVVSCAFGVTQEAARVAIEDGEPFIRECRTRYARHRDITLSRLRALPGVTVPEPSGAFYVFPKLEGLLDSYAFCRRLVEEYRLGLAPGSAFGAGGEGHVRLCFAVDEPTLIEALDRFETTWAAERRNLAAGTRPSLHGASR